MRILLADDSNVAQRMGKEILAPEGFEVVTVSNGQAALKMLQQFVPDLVLADIFMPGRNGYEVCQFIKSEVQLSHIPVVLLVGTLEPYDRQQGSRVKADGLITKPLQSSTLLKIVKNLLPPAKSPSPAAAPAHVAAVPKAALVDVTAKDHIAKESPQEPSTFPPVLDLPQQIVKEPVAAFVDHLEPIGTSAVNPVLSDSSKVPENLPPEFPIMEAEPAVRASLDPGVSHAERPLSFLDQLFESVDGREAKPPTSEQVIESKTASASPVLALAPETDLPAHAQAAGAALKATEETDPETATAAVETTGEERRSEKLPETESQLQSGERTEAVIAEVQQAPLDSQQGSEDSAEAGPPPTAEIASLQPQTPAKPVWTAEPALVSPEDEKLFDEPFPDWEELTKVVEEEDLEEEDEEDDEESFAGLPLLVRAEEVSAVAVQRPEQTSLEAGALPPMQGPSTESGQLSMNEASLEHLIRQSVEKIMPEIVDRIVRTVGESLCQTER